MRLWHTDCATISKFSFLIIQRFQQMGKQMFIILKKELRGYLFSLPSLIFLIIFLILQAIFTFMIGGFYSTGHSSLDIFFYFHPWLYLFLLPALSMRVWAEEKRSGTYEILKTLPISLVDITLGKFLALWFFVFLALILTFPIVITVYYLGSPDFGPIFSAYLISWIMAGAYISISCFTSSLTQNQVVSFVCSVLISFLFVILGFDIFKQYLTFLPINFYEFITNMSFITHFEKSVKGIIDSRDLIFFFSIIFLFLNLNIKVLKK